MMFENDFLKKRKKKFCKQIPQMWSKKKNFPKRQNKKKIRCRHTADRQTDTFFRVFESNKKKKRIILFEHCSQRTFFLEQTFDLHMCTKEFSCFMNDEASILFFLFDSIKFKIEIINLG